MKLRQYLVTLLTNILLLVGCAPTSLPPRIVQHGKPVIDVHVYIEPEFSERERAHIINGILMWERATGGLVVWHLFSYNKDNPIPPPRGTCNGVQERTVLFRRAVSSDEWVQRWDAAQQPKKYLLGLCQGNALLEVTWLWLIEDRLSTSRSQTVIASHEFGHALGLNHVSDKESVMSEFSNNTNCLTNHDLHEFCRHHHCLDSMMTTSCNP